MAERFTVGPTTIAFTARHSETIDDPQYLFAEKKVLSHAFSDYGDPREFNFHLETDFGKYDEGRLSGILRLGGRREVKVLEWKMIILHPKKSKPLDVKSLKLFDFNLDFGQKMTGDVCSAAALSALAINKFKLSVKVTYSYRSAPLNYRDSTMPDHMLALFEEPEDADVTFRVGNEIIKAHEIILSARSTYFRNLFKSGMQEARTKEIDIADAEPSVFKELLKFVYSGISPLNLYIIAKKLLPLADRYDIDPLKDMCIRTIIGTLSKTDVIEVMLLADLHDSKDLMEECIPIFKENLKYLKESDDWNSLKQSPELAVRLLESFVDDNDGNDGNNDDEDDDDDDDENDDENDGEDDNDEDDDDDGDEEEYYNIVE